MNLHSSTFTDQHFSLNKVDEKNSKASKQTIKYTLYG